MNLSLRTLMAAGLALAGSAAQLSWGPSDRRSGARRHRERCGQPGLCSSLRRPAEMLLRASADRDLLRARDRSPGSNLLSTPPRPSVFQAPLSGGAFLIR